MKHLFAAALLVAICSPLLLAEDLNWPEFRGPRGNGTTTSSKLPLRWGEDPGDKTVKWKTAIHGKAWSSPVIWGKQIWLTSATEDGRELFVLCVEPQTGKIVRDQKLFDVEKPQYCIPFNSYASPTPALEQDRVYVTFGAAGTACLESQSGKVVWTRRDLECNHYRGPGSSPILFGRWLFLNFDGSDQQYVVALDKQTGETVWKTTRSIDFKDLDSDGKPETEGDSRKAFATCQIITLDGQPVLLSQGSKAVYAYVPSTGKEIWRLEDYGSYSGCTRPVSGHGLIYIPSGFPSGQVLAIKPGKTGEQLDVKTNGPPAMQLQVVWKDKHHAPKKPSLLLVDDLLYAIDDNGVVTCWEADNGKVVWSENIGGHFTAAPLAAPGRIYLFSEEGKTTVVATGREFKKLAESQLGDGFMASPAISGNALFLRTRTQLFRIED
ncbi:MAG TPA: PQQ-binding-like beta-propeller repeat protein [Candidatus Limnocylindrales bacterium]|jgi:outer membrane protein assembly factor BamB|nr:PQQ-binding-like beta-propeller repeat protein [Candidatus Limnocylindrales bacterium]